MGMNDCPFSRDFPEQNGLLAHPVERLATGGNGSSDCRVHDGPGEIVALEMHIDIGKPE